MAIAEQLATDEYAIFLGDSMEVLPTLPDESIHLSIYSPPFATEQGGALYHYTSSERDLSNSRTYAEFLDHYGFFVREIHRLTKPGRITAVHCTDVPTSNSGGDAFADFPGDIIRLHRANGWDYVARYHVWKEPLTVRNRTMKKDLAHRTLTEDSTRCSVAAADYLLCFRRHGENTVPVTHPQGLTEYAGERPIRTSCCRGATGLVTSGRTASRIGSGDSTRRRSGMTSGSIGWCRSGKPGTTRTSGTCIRCSSMSSTAR